MFRNQIKETALSTAGAEEYFAGKIYGDSFDRDTTFLSTLRALMDSRLPHGEKIHLSIVSGNVSREMIATRTYDSVFKRTLCNFDPYLCSELYICNFNRNDEECNKDFVRFVHENFTKMYGNDWHVLEDVTTLYRKSFDCLCFVNPDLKSTLIVVTDMNLRKYHYLQCAILGMLPWYFDREKGITEEESELIYSLREKESDKYLEAIKKFAVKYDFETARLKKLLHGISTRSEQKRLEETKREIDGLRNQINEMNETIGRYISRLNEYNISLLGQMAVIENKSDDDEMLKYFEHNKSVHLETVRGTCVYFFAKGILSYFDPDTALHMIEKNTSFVYENCHINSVGKKDLHDLMIKVFVDQEVQIKFCAAYCIDLNGNVEGLSDYEFPQLLDDYMPNPHINKYRCLGNYATLINKLVYEGKIIEAVEQCVSSSRSLNWSDYYVMSAFFAELLSNNKRKCFILPDGTETTIRGALEWTVINRDESESNSDPASDITNDDEFLYVDEEETV